MTAPINFPSCIIGTAVSLHDTARFLEQAFIGDMKDHAFRVRAVCHDFFNLYVIGLRRAVNGRDNLCAAFLHFKACPDFYGFRFADGFGVTVAIDAVLGVFYNYTNVIFRKYAAQFAGVPFLPGSTDEMVQFVILPCETVRS